MKRLSTRRDPSVREQDPVDDVNHDIAGADVGAHDTRIVNSRRVATSKEPALPGTSSYLTQRRRGQKCFKKKRAGLGHDPVDHHLHVLRAHRDTHHPSFQIA